MTTRMTLLLFAFALVAKADNLQGFLYGEKSAPDGTEWQNPELLALNKEQPRTCLFSFANTQEALKVLPEGSSYYQSLDGTWKFHWVPSPEKRPMGFYQPEYDVTAWDGFRLRLHHGDRRSLIRMHVVSP